MSGPVEALDFEVSTSREAVVGRMRVRRALPKRTRRTVGPWCFADHMGPAQVTPSNGIDIGPHPHIGLQTVTWLIEGSVLHRDSLGSVQVIEPGQLNLMTAGRGVSHSEEAVGTYSGGLEGIQLWIAQPAETRFGDPAFEHRAELPVVRLGSRSAPGDVTGTVLVGSFAGAMSPARVASPTAGVELAFGAGDSPVEVPLETAWEHALIVLRGTVGAGSESGEMGPGELAYLEPGPDSVLLSSPDSARALLIGGLPFGEEIKMWWNFVARTAEEIAEAREAWEAGPGGERFGFFSSPLDRIPAPPLIGLR